MSFKPKAIFFDLDGTLIEFHHDYLMDETHKIVEMLEHPPVDREVLEDAFSSFDYFRFVAEHVREHFIERFWDHFDWNGFPTATPFEQTLPTLEALSSAGVVSAIVTSRFVPKDDLRKNISHTGILDFVSHIETRPGDHIHWTDKTKMITDTCEALGLKPAEVAMIGDIPTDITSAKEVGVGCSVAVRSGGIRLDVLQAAEPDLVLEHIGELLGKLF